MNITLEPGQVSERVTVTAAPAALETESATVGQVVTTRSILPSEGVRLWTPGSQAQQNVAAKP